MTVAAQQALLARFLDDPALERRVRAEPAAMAAEFRVPPSFTRWLAALPEDRVTSFRRSRVHEDALRAGKEPTRK